MQGAVTLVATVTNPDVGDRQLDDAGRAVVHTDRTTEVAQMLFIRFFFFKGEWFLNLNSGTPWYQKILRKQPSDKIIRAVFTKIITGCPGVVELRKFSYSLSSDRRLSVRFTAILDDGSVLSSADYVPYVVPV